MAQKLKDIFKENLYIPPKEIMENLPSPEELRGKIVIKGKRPPEDDNTPLTQEDDFDPYTSKASISSVARTTGSEASRNSNSPNGKKNSTKPPKIVPSLASITLFHGAGFKSFDESFGMPVSHMHSIGETKISKLIGDAAANAMYWKQYNIHHLTRTYPAGVRINSSNYNPVLAWSVGCQLGKSSNMS